MGALLAPHHRCQQLIPDPFRQGHDLVHHLVDGLGTDRAIALGAVGFSGAAEEQTQIILDFRHRAHGGAGVVAGGFLIDRNGWRQPLNRIHIGLVHLAEKLARIGGQALDVPPLPLGKDRVEGQGALATATHTGENHQPVAGNRQINILEIVLAGTPHPDHILEGSPAQHRAAVQVSGFLVDGLGEGSGGGTGGSRALGAGHPAVTATADSIGVCPGLVRISLGQGIDRSSNDHDKDQNHAKRVNNLGPFQSVTNHCMALRSAKGITGNQGKENIINQPRHPYTRAV